MRYLVFLDAGHGLDTPGKRTPLFEDGSFMRENEFNRYVVRKIDSLLEKYENIDVYFVSPEKRDVMLEQRVNRVNEIYERYQDIYQKSVLISIHANAYGDGKSFNSASGTSTHYYPTNMNDKEFAEIIHRNLIESTSSSKDRGIAGSDFQILREVKMTAALCENLFMTNLGDAKLLLTNEFRDNTAKGIVRGLLEYFKIVPSEFPEKSMVEYSATQNGTHQLCGNVSDFSIKTVNKKNLIIEEPNCVNGTFFWYSDELKTKTYPTSIMVKDGVILQDAANHYYSFNCPQSVFIVYKNGSVEMKKIFFASELDYKNIQTAIGGIGLRDVTNQSFNYDPASEGFKKGFHKQTGQYVDYSGVLRKTNKTVIGYNINKNKIYLMCRKNISHKSLFEYDLLNLVRDCEYDIALSVDGGGSTFMNNNTGMVVFGDNRVINNIAGFFR